MRKILQFSALLTLFLLFSAPIIWAQTISNQKGLTIVSFSTPNGSVKIYLPDGIRSGDVISGTVIAEPSGKNNRQVKKNLSKLSGYLLLIEGKRFPINENASTIKWLVNSGSQENIPIEIIEENGGKIASLSCPVNNTSKTENEKYSSCVIPSHALVGQPLQIKGQFDGDMSNTSCAISNKPAVILAESPRNCIISFSDNAQGLQTIQVNENEKPMCNQPISGVNMEVTAGNLNLRKGQNTFINVKLSGLENLPDKALLTITNITPNIVTMTNGNLQVYPVWPLADTANGTFSVHCPAVSINTGSFSVLINLDLPEPGNIPSPNVQLPPGYSRKSCNCDANVAVTKDGNNFISNAKPACTGVYGIGINTFSVCQVLSISYNWEIKSGNENVAIIGKTNEAAINIKTNNSGNYTICNTVTVKCIDGTICSRVICVNESGKTISDDKTESKPPVLDPPITGETKEPVTTTGSKCQCIASCTVKETSKADKEVTYSAEVKAECKGSYGKGSTRSICAVGPITYAWSIGAGGKDVAEIVGKADGKSVKIKLKKDGAYNVYLTGTVTCSDGTICKFYCNLEIPIISIPGEKLCQPIIEDKGNPVMDGGLKASYLGIGNKSSIYRDEYIALEAVGGDVDMVKIICQPREPCLDTKSEKTIPVNGRVKFEWKILGKDNGSFVKLGCLPDEDSTEGDHVIFKPPYVPLPVNAADTTIVTIIKLYVVDDGSPVKDGTKIKTITIKTKRIKRIPDKYTVSVTSEKYTLPMPAPGPVINGTCSINGPNWLQLDDLVKPTIELPAVEDNSKMVLGQWIVLNAADQRDKDLLKFNCVSLNKCSTGPQQNTYEDVLLWDWKLISGGGRIILSPTGRYIIYQAPLSMLSSKEMIKVKINVTARNPSGSRSDAKKPPGEIELHVYRPGVSLSRPPATWVPEDSNHVELTSELKYMEGGQWKPALAHMCRILYFELVNISKEKGICLNAPIQKEAELCRDFKLTQESGHEAFDERNGTGKCSLKDLFQQARTKRPEKVYRIKVSSLDFGSYGFLRSFANVNKKTTLRGTPKYVSIPIQRADVRHPLGRQKKTVYKDNRVTIPVDIDENRIPDAGWTSVGGVRVSDPANNRVDEDPRPTGDNFNGDGFTTYEEYRGFKISTTAGVIHRRLNYNIKDIFIRNEHHLPITLYSRVSALSVHEITEDQYISDSRRYVNFNYNRTTHLNFMQRGLHLINKGNHASLLGEAHSTTRNPTVPNAEIEIRVYTTKIQRVVNRVNLRIPRANRLSYANKLAATVAHELLHGNNVCHHGEGNPALERSADAINGLRSGVINCVMRYDNAGTRVQVLPEFPGTRLCTSAVGTGYNAGGARFGNAAANRGNCTGQIRVSGSGGVPKTCGNR